MGTAPELAVLAGSGLARGGRRSRVLPLDDFPMLGAVFTDVSVCQVGGAAAAQPEEEEEEVRSKRIAAPCNSPQCEFVALLLALDVSPSQILTDSLASLTILHNWGRWSVQRTLQCPDCVELRHFLYGVGQAAALPRLMLLPSASVAFGR